MSASDNDRISYLSGEPVDSLTPQERAELDELRTLLDTPATWEEPDAGLEDRIVSAIADEARREQATASRTCGRWPSRCSARASRAATCARSRRGSSTRRSST